MSTSTAECHTRVSALFQCLASPVRTRLIEQLLDGPACVHELVDALVLPQPLISQHLRVLRSQDLVSCTRRGREVLYELDDEHVAHIVRDALAHAAEPGGPADPPLEDHPAEPHPAEPHPVEGAGAHGPRPGDHPEEP